MITPTQSEGEDRDTVIGAIFALILERKSKEYPDIRTFLEKIGMSLGSYYNLCKGVGNPTFWTVERTAKALGLSSWDLLGVDEKLMRAWLAGQNIDVDKVAKCVEERRLARQGFSLDQFGIQGQMRTQTVIEQKEPSVGRAASAAIELERPLAIEPKQPRKGRKLVALEQPTAVAPKPTRKGRKPVSGPRPAVAPKQPKKGRKLRKA